MKAVYTETALAEIDEIISYIADSDPVAADRVSRAIERAIAWAARRPLGSAIVFGDNIRAKLARPYQYRIFYEIDGERLIVRNVRSTRRQRPWEED